MKNFFCVVLISLCMVINRGAAESVTWTMYNIAVEADFPPGSDIDLNSCQGSTFTTVGRQFAQSIRLEGSGYLNDGRFLNLACCDGCEGSGCSYDCFEETSGPLGSNDNILVPYISMASNDIPYGTIIYVSELDGFRLPSGETHNGCVRVDDQCGTCDDHWLDFYVYSLQNLEWLQDNGMFENTDVEYPASCQLQSYTP